MTGIRTAERSVDPDPISDALLLRFLSLFSGREGVYARQWVNPQRDTGYTPIREPFTLLVARNHLLGNHTVGVYPVRLDNTVNFMTLDLDLSRAVVDRHAPGQPQWEGALSRLSAYACQILTLADDRGLSLVLEDSGGKGRHIWAFFAEPVPARLARRLGMELLRLSGPPPLDVNVEVFPKQVTLAPDALGNLIKLPLGVHRLSGRRADFLHADGSSIADQHAFLMGIPRLQQATVVDFLEAVPASLEVTVERSGEALEPPLADEYAIDDDEQIQLVLSRCATLRAVLAQVDDDARLSNDEAVVLVHTLGHLENGPAAVNQLLRRCHEADASLYLTSRLRGNPISCPRIRQRIPHLTSRVPCNCQFDPRAGLYPTPLLHAQAVAAGPVSAELQALQFQAMLGDFLRVRKLLHDAQRQYDRYAQRMAEWFDRAGIDEFRTSFGILKRVRGEDGQSAFQLEV